jgi:predicted AAA+ superfamily ATPase
MAEQAFDWQHTPAAVWRRHRSGLRAIRRLDPVQWPALTGIDHQKQALARNTERFLAGDPPIMSCSGDRGGRANLR